jgi:hypothetical protein
MKSNHEMSEKVFLAYATLYSTREEFFNILLSYGDEKFISFFVKAMRHFSKNIKH